MNSFRTSIKVPAWYHGLSLRAQLATGFAAVISLALSVGVVSLVAQHLSSSAVDRLVDVVGPIEESSKGANVAMLKARRAEKDFLIFQDQFGFREAKSRYVTLFRTNLADVRQHMVDLRALNPDPEAVRLTRSVATAVDAYEEGFLKAVDMFGLRGQGRHGLAGRFGQSADAIEAIVMPAGSSRLIIDVLTLRGHEKDFVAQALDKHLDSFGKAIERFNADLSASRLDPAVRARLGELTSLYEESFRAYARMDTRIDAEQASYLAAAHTVEPQLEKLHLSAKLNAGATRNAAEAVERIAFWAICVAVVLASTLGIAIGATISRGVASSVDKCLGFAGRIVAGDLTTRLLLEGKNEFATLASALNRMTESLQERDAQLQQSNALLRLEAQEREVAVERAQYLAYYDSLTALPNRAMFSKLLGQTLALARRSAAPFAVLFMDLDGFKKINDTLGHEAGDLLLQEVGKRVKACLRDSDTVARLGGDEFVALLPSLRDAGDSASVARKILAAIGEPFTVLGQEFRVTASVGISTFPDDGDDEQTLMKNADIAMYQAKESGKCNFQFYSEQMNRNSFERLALESRLRRALEAGEFELHYQPEVDARGDGIVGVEALLRWKHPELGMVAPAKFLPIAEETGLIVSIGRWVLRTACAQVVSWQNAGLPALRLGVNLSRRQLTDEGVLDDVARVLRDTGMRAHLLQLEITEKTLHGADNALATLHAFKKMGVRIAIDDFGMGYSSLSDLGQFPVDTIKIDGSFFRDLTRRAENRRLAESVIAMGRTLSKTVVAEGVETKAQADFLRDRSCDQLQGFYFGRAVAAAQFGELLRSHMATDAKAA